MLAVVLALSLTKMPPPTRVEIVDDPILAARFLENGDAVIVTTHRIVAMTADGSRENVAPAGCAPAARAAISPDGAWVALACKTSSASGLFQPKRRAPVSPLALDAADRFVFCGDTLHVAHSTGSAVDQYRYPIGPDGIAPEELIEISAEEFRAAVASGARVITIGGRVDGVAGVTNVVADPPDFDAACAGNETWVTAPPSTRALGPVVGLGSPAEIVILEGGMLKSVDATGARRAGPVYAGRPEAAARVGDAWLVLDGGKLFTLPTAFSATAADGFFVNADAHLWVWRGARAERLVWTPSMATRPKLPPAAPLLFSPPTEVRADFVRFRERNLDAVAIFVPSGDDLYGYLLVLSDRRGGQERIDAEACEVTAEHWAQHVGRERGAVMNLSACKQGSRVDVVSHGSDAVSAEEEPNDRVIFRATTFEGERVTFAEMAGYGPGTELWLWRYDPATGDFEEVSGGMPPILELPGEP